MHLIPVIRFLYLQFRFSFSKALLFLSVHFAVSPVAVQTAHQSRKFASIFLRLRLADSLSRVLLILFIISTDAMLADILQLFPDPAISLHIYGWFAISAPLPFSSASVA
jgi:hypothetical protein